jgi:HK97 family phage portal protein
MAAKTKARKKSRAKPKSQALAPRTKKAEPEVAPRHVYVFRNAGVKVNEDTALTLGAVFACVKVISEDIAGLPWRVHEKRAAGGSVEIPDDPVDWLIHTQASPETPAFQFREAILGHVLTWGNGYAEIERDMAGRPAWLWLLTPDRVTPFRDGGEIWYEVQNPVGEPTYLPAEDVFHLRGLGFDGLVGYSVIKLAARSIGAGIALDQSTSDLFANDSTPGGTLNHPGKLTKEAIARLKDDWEKRHMGPLNRRRVAILEEGLKWEQTGLPPEDTKLIEQRQFTPADIARWFRVSPVKIQDLLRATFSNIEELAIWHVTDTLLPWARRLETEANIKLFGRTNRGRRFTKLNFHALLRGNTAAQTAHIKEMLGWGVYNVNEAKAYLDQNPIGPDGEKRFVPMNMQLLEKAGEEEPEPKVPPPGSDPDADPDTEVDDEEEEEEETPALAPVPDIGKALLPVFEDACRRLLRTETERAKTALKGGPEKVALWFEKVRDDHAGYVCMQLRPAVTALALSRGASPELIDAALGVAAERHVDGLHDRLLVAVKNPTEPPAWEALAGEMATQLLGRLTAAVEVTK